MIRIKIKIYLPIIICALISVMFSCTKSEPRIVYGLLKLVIYQGENGNTENFSFFIMCEDEDGIDNLDALYLYHDKEQLRWQIKSDEWLYQTIDGKDWIGTRSITSPEGILPRGVFRAVLVNKGGEKTERNFVFDGNVRFSFPKISVQNGEYNIVSQWPVNRMVCYDNSGVQTSVITPVSKSGSISDLKLPSSVRTIALWAEDESNSCSAFTDVIPVN